MRKSLLQSFMSTTAITIETMYISTRKKIMLKDERKKTARCVKAVDHF